MDFQIQCVFLQKYLNQYIYAYLGQQGYMSVIVDDLYLQGDTKKECLQQLCLF